MNEADKKFPMTEVLGEIIFFRCNSERPPDYSCMDDDTITCATCKYSEPDLRSFATDTDVMDLMRAMVSQGKWVRFYLTVIDSYYHSSAYKGNRWGMTADMIDWLFLSVEPDGVRTFAKLAGEFYRKDGK